MPDILTRVIDTAAQVPIAVRSVEVLRRAGLVELTRPDEMLRSLLYVRQLGPFAGAVRIAARRDPRAIGLVDERGPVTFTELDRRSNALARAWRDRGITDRDVIGLLCRDHRGLLDSMFAAAKLGARAVLLNTGFAGRQLADVAARENISTVVYDEEFSATVAALPDQVTRYLAWVDEPAGDATDTSPAGTDTEPADDTTGSAEASGAATHHGVPAIEDLIRTTDTAPLRPPREPGGIVLLTSGTTGTPKGAPRQVRSPLAAAEFLDRVPYRRNEATVISSPLFHATGLSQFVITLALGSTTVLMRRFDPETVLSRIAQYRCTGLVVVPTMLQRILDIGDDVLSRYDTSSLRILFTAGSALSPELGNRATKVFGDVIYNLYGSTEVAVATIATPDDWRAAPGTVGSPPVGCRVRLYDEHGNRVREPYQQGRIFVGSGLTFAGYTSGESKEEIGGLMSTGDVGHFDSAGRLFIDGRADDMIVSGGENVYPGEVENLLVEHEAIKDAAVIGVPDPEYGQRLKAYVVLEPGAELSADEIKAYVKGHLARYKVPREVAYTDSLPRNPTGKLLRNELT